jgi:hypothetical protein
MVTALAAAREVLDRDDERGVAASEDREGYVFAYDPETIAELDQAASTSR